MAPRKTRATSKQTTNGLSLSGLIIDRTRRMVPRNNPTTEIVTYTIQDEDLHKFYVDDYAPQKYYELDTNVCLPVYVKAYNRKDGTPSYNLSIQKGEPIRNGERF